MSMDTENKKEKSINIDVNTDGSMNLNMDGNFSLYEIIGLLTVSLLDVSSKHFIVPYLNEQSKRLVDHLVEELKGSIPDGEDVKSASKDVSELNDSVKQIMGLVESFKNIGNGVTPNTEI